MISCQYQTCQLNIYKRRDERARRHLQIWSFVYPYVRFSIHHICTSYPICTAYFARSSHLRNFCHFFQSLNASGLYVLTGVCTKYPTWYCDASKRHDAIRISKHKNPYTHAHTNSSNLILCFTFFLPFLPFPSPFSLLPSPFSYSSSLFLTFPLTLF